MSVIPVSVPGSEYEILVEPGILGRAGEILRPLLSGHLAVIGSDANVRPLFAGQLEESLRKAGFRTAVLEIPAGETSKTPEMLAWLWEEMLESGITRTDAVIALGGGVTGDLAGFAAATVLRGVDLVQVPTTLLAQVDASVGGKVAVDLKAGKNLAGAFYQPRAVLMDPDCLACLPDRAFYDGMAEVIKYGCIQSPELFRLLDQLGNRENVMAHIDEILSICCSIKRDVVVADEKDKGLRMMLNFGHTLGHVYERAYNYETYTHGEAVAAGMAAAARIGCRMGITPADLEDKIAGLLKKFHLPTEIAASRGQYAEILARDKKTDGDRISFVALEALGKVRFVKLPLEELMQDIEEAGLCL